MWWSSWWLVWFVLMHIFMATTPMNCVAGHVE
jgi:hypothetical protein